MVIINLTQRLKKCWRFHTKMSTIINNSFFESLVRRMRGSSGKAGSTRPPRSVSIDISCDCLSDVLKSIVTDEFAITRRVVSGKCVGQKQSRHIDLRKEE